MSFAPKPGCPMCGIVSQAQRQRDGLVVLPSPNTSPSPSSPRPSSLPEVLWHDSNFTAYRERTNPVSSQGHIIIAFHLHVPSIYTLSSSDLPLLTSIREIATRLLSSLAPMETAPASPTSSVTLTQPEIVRSPDFSIGFITPPFRDPRIPVTDHLHAHAFIRPADRLGWFRGIAYSSLAWYDIDDLIAEIRESVSNNRIKSGYENRQKAPIHLVPDAGARSGTADGLETTEASLASSDDVEGQRHPGGSRHSQRILSLPTPYGSSQV